MSVAYLSLPMDAGVEAVPPLRVHWARHNGGGYLVDYVAAVDQQACMLRAPLPQCKVGTEVVTVVWMLAGARNVLQKKLGEGVTLLWPKGATPLELWMEYEVEPPC